MNEQIDPESTSPGTPRAPSPEDSFQETAASGSAGDGATYEDVLRAAAEDAAEVAAYIGRRIQEILGHLRTGRDHEALTQLTRIAPCLEDFLSFLVHAIGAAPDHGRTFLLQVHDAVMDGFEGINRALEAGDMVDVSDCLEEDVLSALARFIEAAPELVAWTRRTAA